jgi:hypothetical protein
MLSISVLGFFNTRLEFNRLLTRIIGFKRNAFCKYLALVIFVFGCERMKKICPRCGVIFDVPTSEAKFCSGKCEKIFQESSLGYLKRGNASERKVYAP